MQEYSTVQMSPPAYQAIRFAYVVQLMNYSEPPTASPHKGQRGHKDPVRVQPLPSPLYEDVRSDLGQNRLTRKMTHLGANCGPGVTYLFDAPDFLFIRYTTIAASAPTTKRPLMATSAIIIGKLESELVEDEPRLELEPRASASLDPLVEVDEALECVLVDDLLVNKGDAGPPKNPI